MNHGPKKAGISVDLLAEMMSGAMAPFVSPLPVVMVAFGQDFKDMDRFRRKVIGIVVK
jgi:hypothetical protein